MTRLPNEIEVISGDGEIWTEGVYANSEKDIARYQAGRYINIRYALEELKSSFSEPKGNRHEVVLSVKISD